MRKLINLLCALAVFACSLPAYARTAPVAASFSTAVAVNAQTVLQLQGSDADGTPLAYAVASAPSHGALTQLDAATGAVVYTPAAGYSGADSFAYNVTSGGETSANGTVSITVTSARTRVIDTFTAPDGTPRQGKVTFVLTKAASSPSGIMPAAASVSAALNASGQFDVSLIPSRAVSPVQWYQVYFYDAGGSSQLLGVYDIPASTAPISLAGHRVTSAGGDYVFATKAEVEALTQAVAAATAAMLFPTLVGGRLAYWNGTTFANSSITENGTGVTVGGVLNAGAVRADSVTAGRFVGIQPADVPDLDAVRIKSGTLSPARIPSILNGITCVGCTNVGVGTGGGLVNSGDTAVGSTGGRVSIQTAGAERIGVDNDGKVTVPNLVAGAAFGQQPVANPMMWRQEREQTPVTEFAPGDSSEMYNPGPFKPGADVYYMAKAGNSIYLWKLANGLPPRIQVGKVLTCTSGWCASGAVDPKPVYNSSGNADVYFKGWLGSVYQVGHAVCAGPAFTTCVKDPLPVLTPSQVGAALEGGAAIADLSLSDVNKDDAGGYDFYGYYSLAADGTYKIFHAHGTTMTNPVPDAILMTAPSKAVIERPSVIRAPGSNLWVMVFSEGGPQATPGLTEHMALRVATSHDKINWRVEPGTLLEPQYVNPLGLNFERDGVFAAMFLKKADASPNWSW